MERNKSILSLLGGIGTGVALMYLLDPDRGARRRSLLLDKASSVSNDIPIVLGKTRRDITNRAYGIWSQATSTITGSRNVDDVTLENRIRSKIGRVVSHPRAIYISADRGTVRVWGNILADEVDQLIACVQEVPGMQTVENKLTPHSSAGNIPDLQSGSGQKRRGQPHAPFFQGHWAPAERVVAGAAGGLMVLFGASLLTRSLTNTKTKRLIGTGGRQAVTVEKAINVDAPPDVLFALWSNFENFPKFMTNVREVRITGANTSHWVVAGPAGVPVEWDAEVTKVEPDRMIAWKSIEGSVIANAGYVRFGENQDGTTRVTARISYNPPAGAIGHAVATIFGVDPKTQMDQDLLRMKMLLEAGRAAHDAAQKPDKNAEIKAQENDSLRAGDPDDNALSAVG